MDHEKKRPRCSQLHDDDDLHDEDDPATSPDRSSTGETSPAKKRRSGATYNYYKGIRKRPCICLDHEECNKAFHHFVDVKDRKRCGYFRLSRATKQSNVAAEASSLRGVLQ
jgi:hypothetical protein